MVQLISVRFMNLSLFVVGKTGLLIWAITLAGLLGGGALLVYNTSAPSI
jgi:photosystem II 10kDa protein